MTDTPPTPTSRRYPGLRPFQKGVSGNAKGRPPVARDIRELARQHGPAVFARLLQLALSRVTMTGLGPLEQDWSTSSRASGAIRGERTVDEMGHTAILYKQYDRS